MIFIETPIFTEDLSHLLSGDVIQNTGGLRKVRWAAAGKDKRGGVRVIYYHVTSDA